MRQHRLYKAVWFWSDENRLSFHSGTEREKTKQAGPQLGISRSKDSLRPPTTLFFIENIDQNQQRIFKQKYQRIVRPSARNVVTMQDIKDVVMFLAIGNIPRSFLELFNFSELNLLFRALIVYHQLYLKVWEDLVYRSTSYGNKRLKHPISIERETLCKTHLSKLRSRIGQEYALIIAGEGKYRKLHHMNNTLNRSYTAQDMIIFDYFSKFTIRVVWVALNRINFKEIEMEICRLFHFKDIDDRRTEMEDKSNPENEASNNILQGDKPLYLSDWHKMSPVIADIFINQNKPELFLSHDEFESESKRTKISGLEAALKLPEELLSRFGVTVGILGQPRDNFEPLLTVRQKQKSVQDEEMEQCLATIVEEVKPKIKMYEYLKELETTIDLEDSDLISESGDIMSEIEGYRKSHTEDSKRSFSIWEHDKSQRYSF